MSGNDNTSESPRLRSILKAWRVSTWPLQASTHLPLPLCPQILLMLLSIRNSLLSDILPSRGGLQLGGWDLNTYAWIVLDESDPNYALTVSGDYGAVYGGLIGCFVRVSITVTITNGCRFTMDGPFPSDQCGRILWQTIECDQSK
jgi:hypothetical protein